jgi:streptogramin lyase
VFLAPLDEVGHDQEVAREAHLDDDAELEPQPFPIFLLGAASSPAPRGASQAFLGLVGQLLGLAAAVAGREAGQDRIALVHHEGAAAGDVEGVVAGFRQVGEQLAHVLGRLEPVLGRHAPALVLADEGAVGDAQQGVVGVVDRGLA